MKLPWHKKSTVRILSIDGGGIRGYIPALILEHISKLLKPDKTSLYQVFDLIAGTSSGSLTTLGITSPEYSEISGSYLKKNQYTMSEIVNIYETCRTDIFPQRTFDQMGVVKQAFHEKYNSEGLEKILDSIFGTRKMSDCLTEVLISSFDVFSNKPVMFGKNSNLLMKDAARGSAAAPTFFEPALVKTISGDKEFCLVDGAMAANNPSMFAYTQAREMFPEASDFFILSLGTGKSPKKYKYEQIKNWGFLEWITPLNGTPIYSIMSRAQETGVGIQLNQIPGVSYYRFNPVLYGSMLEIDNISVSNMKNLKSTALETIKTNENLMYKIASELSTGKTSAY